MFNKNNTFMEWDEFQLRYRIHENINWLEHAIKLNNHNRQKNAKSKLFYLSH